MSFPRYPAYKDSGVKWLGEVPEHWSVAALNFRYEVLLGKMLDEKRVTGQHLAPYLRNVDVQWDRINIEDLPQMDFSGDDIERYGLRPGDLLVCEGGEVGRAAIWAGEVQECYYQKALHRLRARRPLEDLPRFQFYLLRAAVDLGVFTAAEGKSTIAHLTAEALRRYRFAYPSPTEQEAIAAFLDRETAKIDALVAEQEKLIALLQEKRQAVISHAVTKGLDPNVPMKDSGVEWLGEVPGHWEISQLRRVVRKGTSVTYGIVQAGPDIEGGVPYIRTSDMSGDALPVEGYLRTSSEIDAAYSRSKVAAGDLVIAIRASVGKCLPVPPELDGANLTQGTAKISPGDSTEAAFLLAYMSSDPVQTLLDAKSKGATFKEITLETLRKTPVLVPPRPEQEEIATRVRMEGGRFAALIAAAESAKTLLKERRAALISAAVTGQIDVRGTIETEVA